jgi:hypothetical protein
VLNQGASFGDDDHPLTQKLAAKLPEVSAAPLAETVLWGHKRVI